MSVNRLTLVAEFDDLARGHAVLSAGIETGLLQVARDFLITVLCVGYQIDSN